LKNISRKKIMKTQHKQYKKSEYKTITFIKKYTINYSNIFHKIQLIRRHEIISKNIDLSFLEI